ncbi:MAG: type I-C CRISPR-associated protein Cas8c/Csd1 [Ruminococcus sp.]|nr:type I-C CRISPR-associated protein Cas8c/Csd1 [Ruminococcus sp.]
MLEALYKYATDNELAVKTGFKAKNVKYYISFSASGDFIGFDIVEKDAPLPLCPDIGESNTQGDKCNFLVVRAEILLNIKTDNSGISLQKKHDFYMNMIQQAAEHDSFFEIAYNSLKANLPYIRDEFFSLKVKPKPNIRDLLSIKVNNECLESHEQYRNWWIEYLNGIKNQSEGNVRCLITGNLTKATSIVDKINTPLPSSIDPKTVSKAKLICFDKDAFQSYGFDQSLNAPVSEEAIQAVNLALDDLLHKNSHDIAGAKHIYWYSNGVTEDVAELPFFDFGFSFEKTEFEIETRIEEDKHRVKKMFESVMNKAIPTSAPNFMYHMMSLCAAKTRIMIRSYDEGIYTDLWQKIKDWFDDICIEDSHYGKRWCSLYSIQTRLIKKTQTNMSYKDILEQFNKELSGIAPRIVYSIYHGTPMPDSVAAKALAYIRSDMYSSSDNEKKVPDRIACQIIKAWHNRKYRNKEDQIMDHLNENSPSKAYQVGRLMAVYAMIQNKALGDVGAGVVERYYTSACNSPALVMGKLATMSQYHLSKLKSDNQGYYVFYSKMLEEIMLKIGTSLPKTFDLKQQSEFALGYYFQRSQAYTGKKTEE